MLTKIFGRFIKFDDVVGRSDELSPLMQDAVDKGKLTERRAYEIKERLTSEYDEGKVKEEYLIKRLAFLKNEEDFFFDINNLNKDLNSESKICPYCFTVSKRKDTCPVCAYDLTHDEKPNVDNFFIMGDDGDLKSLSSADIAGIVNCDEDDEDSVNMTELAEKIEKLGITLIHSFDDENSNENNPEIDLFSILFYMNGDDTFKEAYDFIMLNSNLSEQELFELAFDKGFVDSDKEITDEGYEFVIDNEWMIFYMTYLSSFNFDDFNHFYKDSGDSLENSGLKFLDKHISVAEDKKEFSRLVDAYVAKGHIYGHMGNFINLLRFELKVFLINLNPLYLDDEEILLHIALDDINIDTLCNFNKVFSLSQFKKNFNKEWNSIEFDNIRIPKKQCWKILTNILKGKDIDEYSEKIENKYFK